MTSIANRIEQWFDNHSDGEFGQLPRVAPYSVIVPSGAGERLIYTTKPRVVAEAIAPLEPARRVGVLGRYGLPMPGDVAWIAGMAQANALWFLADLDPPDLLVFA